MIRVGLARTLPHYENLRPPFGPGKLYPELERLGGAGEGPPNHVYAAVRSALIGAGLDAERVGSADWNPLGSLVARGGHVVLKPNFIRHWNPCEEGTVQSVVTHGAIVRAAVDYAFLAVGPEGRVTIAEAPQHDCNWSEIAELSGLDPLVAHYETLLGRTLHVVDLRREAVEYEDAVITKRNALDGDPQGYRMVDLARRSAFEGSGLDPQRFRGADYDAGPTSSHHMGGRNEYLLSETVLSADLVVNLPKLKTHKKTGVTLALKNLVGINGDKNLLPHHCVGSVDAGGDEFPGRSAMDRWRSAATEVARKLLARGIGTGLVRRVRRAENAMRGSEFIRSGNWYGNRTTWRMCLDLNRAFYYSNAEGAHFEAKAPVRRAITLIDGIVAGEGEGPLAPRDVPLGVVIASTDPIALDLTAVRLMGFDWQKLPKLREAMADDTLRITEVRDPVDVEVGECAADGGAPVSRTLDELEIAHRFEPHAGWQGHVEIDAPSEEPAR